MIDFYQEYGIMIIEATGQTCLMLISSVILSYLIGLPLGVLAYVSSPTSIAPNKIVFTTLDWLINMVRSVPFIILLVFIIPFTKMIVGTFIGPIGAIVPLTVGTIPFVARMVQGSFNEVDKGVIESSRAMGATNLQIITRVLVPESMPSLVHGMSITTITLIGYTAMAGTVGGGGLGDVAMRYGFQRYQTDVMVACIIILIIMVQLIQFTFDRIVKKIDKTL